ncbi:hypothetical protein ES703_103259 [subsurface metagenome]
MKDDLALELLFTPLSPHPLRVLPDDVCNPALRDLSLGYLNDHSAHVPHGKNDPDYHAGVGQISTQCKTPPNDH